MEKTPVPPTPSDRPQAAPPPNPRISPGEIQTPSAMRPTVMDHVIPAKNLPALLGYYFGVFSIIPLLGIPLGIAAIICGVFGLRAAGPTGVGGGHAITALILGGLFGGGQCVGLVYLMSIA